MAANIETEVCPSSSREAQNNHKHIKEKEMLARSRNRDTMFQTAAFPAVSAHRVGVRGLAKGSAAVLLASLLVATPVTATAKDTDSEDLGASIALEWQRIALRTMFVDSQPATPVPASPLYFGFSLTRGG